MNVLPKIRVLVVEDHPIVRDGISAIINQQNDLNVVGQAANELVRSDTNQWIPIEIRIKLHVQ